MRSLLGLKFRFVPFQVSRLVNLAERCLKGLIPSLSSCWLCREMYKGLIRAEYAGLGLPVLGWLSSHVRGPTCPPPHSSALEPNSRRASRNLRDFYATNSLYCE